jgi:hypothetical protein
VVKAAVLVPVITAAVNPAISIIQGCCQRTLCFCKGALASAGTCGRSAVGTAPLCLRTRWRWRWWGQLWLGRA